MTFVSVLSNAINRGRVLGMSGGPPGAMGVDSCRQKLIRRRSTTWEIFIPAGAELILPDFFDEMSDRFFFHRRVLSERIDIDEKIVTPTIFISCDAFALTTIAMFTS